MQRSVDEQGNHIISYPEFFYSLMPSTITISEEQAQTILSRYPAPTLPEGVSIDPFDSFAPGQTIKDYLVLVDRLEIKPSNNAPYLNFRCTNSQGSFYAKKWDSKQHPTQETFEALSASPVALVSGKVQEYPKGSGKKSFLMESYVPYSGDIHPLSLLPSTDENLEALTLEFFHYLLSLKEPYRTLSLELFDDYWQEFSMKAAATGKHHNFIGGLLQHTVELMRIDRYLFSVKNLEKELARMNIQLYKLHLIDTMNNRRKEVPTSYDRLPWANSFDHLADMSNRLFTSLEDQVLNTDQILFSHAIHDIGKIFEYANLGESNKFATLFPYASDASEHTPVLGSIVYDEMGGKMGHMPIATMLLHQHLLKSSVSLPKADIVSLMNIILSHHGKKEWGSPVIAMTPESVLVHIVDFVDARFAQKTQ